MKINIRDMALVSMFTALTAIGAFISIPLGPVPITLQSLFVILSGIVLGPKLGALSQIVYIILGLVGLPIFAGFTGGLASIMKPSFGFIIGFVFASFIGGLISHRKEKISTRTITMASLTATVVIYLFGLPYMYYILNNIMGSGFSFLQVFNLGCLLFLPGDTVKFIVASILGVKLLKILMLSNVSLDYKR